jgi:uncharacterized protein (DUF1697 family)
MNSTKYVAFLRGINVGGKNIIKMAALKEVVEKCGYRNVSTFIQSGNVIFEAEEDNIKKVANHLEESLSKAFNYQSKIVLVSHDQLRRVLSEVPNKWKNHDDLRCYIAFIIEPVTAEAVLAEVKLKEGIDSAEVGKGVLYMSTLLSGITKSGFTKLIGTKVYKYITIRNYNTAQKILERMDIK